MSTFTIAHISDLHLSPEHRRRNIHATRKLLEFISSLNVNHLVITGDITSDATKRDFQLARMLLKDSGWLDSRRLSVVIGNHDVYGGIHHLEDMLTFPKRYRQVDLKERVLEFHNQFHEAFENCIYLSNHAPFPYAKVLGDVVLLGLNSVAEYSMMSNPVGSNGRVRKSEFNGTSQLLSMDKFRRKAKVVLIHHHFNNGTDINNGTVWSKIEAQAMRLHKKGKLLEVFRDNEVRLVLHGHLHENREYWKKGLRFVNGGGSVRRRTEGLPQVNIISLTESATTVEQRFAPFSNRLPSPGSVATTTAA